MRRNHNLPKTPTKASYLEVSSEEIVTPTARSLQERALLSHVATALTWHLRQLVVCDALVGLPGAGVGLTQPSRDAFAAVAAVGSARNAAPQELPPGLAFYQHQGVAEDHVEHLRSLRARGQPISCYAPSVKRRLQPQTTLFGAKPNGKKTENKALFYNHGADESLTFARDVATLKRLEDVRNPRFGSTVAQPSFNVAGWVSTCVMTPSVTVRAISTLQ